MIERWARRGGPVLLCVLAILASAGAARVAWETGALSTLRVSGENRLDLVARSVRDAVAREAHFPLVMALDPDVHDVLEAPDDGARIAHLNAKLARFASAASAAALYVLDDGGTTLAASNWDTPDSFVGHNYRFRTYFSEAIEDGEGSYFGIGVTTHRAGYFLSQRIETGDRAGVAVAKIEFYDLEAAWAQAPEHIMVTEANDIVFLSSRQDWKYRALAPIGDDATAYIERTRQFEGTDLDPLALESPGDEPTTVRIEGLDPGLSFLRQSSFLPELGWTVHQFTDLAPVADARRDGTVIGGTGSALAIAILLFFIQRQQRFKAGQRARAELETRVEERTSQLRASNVSLQSQIEERRRTEAELRATQNDLVQAGKLAALGQMSAAIAHEVNQPLTAMRTYVATTRVFVPLGDQKTVLANLDEIDDLALRMARITSHLKTFARKGGLEPPEPVLVSRAVTRALDLIAVQACDSGVVITQSIEPVWTLGNDVRLEQVVLNLVRNAMDAVAEVDGPEIEVVVTGGRDEVVIAVSDNGPGFARAVLDVLFDPFVTTKPSGTGLGLGLTISAEIVRDFGGTIGAANRPEGGARLMVRLPAIQPADTPEPIDA